MNKVCLENVEKNFATWHKSLKKNFTIFFTISIYFYLIFILKKLK